MKSVGAITHPYFTNVRMVKGSDSVSLMRTVAVNLSWKNVRVVKKLIGQQNLDRTFQRASGLMEANALVKSMKPM